MENPKVSVIIPSLNVVPYVRECLESAINQTLQEIEIICVDAGSTDGTAEILREYENKDERVHVITSIKKSYGYQMNLGISMAKGEYIAFLESDDFIAPNAYALLYENAKTNNVDIIKADYIEVRGEKDNYSFTRKHLLSNQSQYYTIYDPSVNPWIFYISMMNCLGLFERKFLEKYHIRHNETPGASYQDMGFWFQTFCLAKSVYFIKEALYHYRQDNQNSSMNNRNQKIYCVRDEYQFMWDFLNKNPDVLEWCAPIYYHRMFGSFCFTYNKLNSTFKPLFLYEVIRKEFLIAKERKDFNISRFNSKEKTLLYQIIEYPDLFLQEKFDRDKTIAQLTDRLSILQLKLNQSQIHINQLQNSNIQRIGIKETNIAVSVIIPVYNTEKYLQECLDSIINQSLKEIEIICINDGSTDGSLEILTEIAQHDNRIKVLTQENMGQSAARNRGLEIAQGKYIYFMDSDDRLKLDALEFLVNESERNELDVLYFDGMTFFDCDDLKKKYKNIETAYIRPHEHRGIYSGIELLVLFHHDNKYQVSPCLQLISRKHLVNQHIMFYEGIIYEDNLFNLQCIISAERVSHRNKQFFERRIRDNSTVTQIKDFRHLYGYLMCYLQMTKLLIEYMWNSTASSEISVELNLISKGIKRYYNGLSREQLKNINSLNSVELSFLKNILEIEKNNYQMIPTTNASLDLQLKKAQQEIRDIHNSYTYKIGRFITFIPRIIRKSLKCYKENGFKYTLYKVSEHLFK